MADKFVMLTENGTLYEYRQKGTQILRTSQWGRVVRLKEGATMEALVITKRAEGKRVIEGKGFPTMATLERYASNGISPTPDGCRVEPDGECSHGWPAWTKFTC